MTPKKSPTASPVKLDLHKQWKHLFNPPSKTAVIVDVPEFQYLMIAGAMEPGRNPETSPSYAAALEALYGLRHLVTITCPIFSCASARFGSSNRHENHPGSVGPLPVHRPKL